MAEPGPDHDPHANRPSGRDFGTPPDERERPEHGNRSPDGTDKPPGIDKDTLRRVRRLIMISALASITSVFLPPVGFVLGIFAAVLVWRWWSALVTPALTRATTVVVVFGTAFALVVGGLGSVVTVMFASELAEYANCQTGANTHQARDKCWDELTGAIEDRLLGG